MQCMEWWKSMYIVKLDPQIFNKNSFMYVGFTQNKYKLAKDPRRLTTKQK